MAIEALYPSRRQSRWANPLFRRPRLRLVRRVAIGALVLALIVAGGTRLLDRTQQSSSNSAERRATIDAPSNSTRQARPEPHSTVRVIPLFS